MQKNQKETQKPTRKKEYGGEPMKKEDLTELVSFSCVLKGNIKYVEQIKACIQEHVNKGHITLITPMYDEKKLHILTEDQWEEYQTLKKSIYMEGIGFPG